MVLLCVRLILWLESLILGVPIKTKPNHDQVLRYKSKIWSRPSPHPRVILSTNLLRDIRAEITLVARSLPTPVSQKLCRCKHCIFTRAEERVLILEHYFGSKSFAVAREAFSNVYPDKKVPNKTTVHGLVAKFRLMLVLETVVDIFRTCCKTVLWVSPNK
jgi:hypothetical protein